MSPGAWRRQRCRRHRLDAALGHGAGVDAGPEYETVCVDCELPLLLLDPLLPDPLAADL